MENTDPIVFVVDDDASVRHSIGRLIRSCGYDVVTFASGREFLRCASVDGPACAVLDVRMPGLNGLELQEELAAADLPIPIVFLTAHGTISMGVEAMRQGAMDFLTKPVRRNKLLAAIEKALDQGRRDWGKREKYNELRSRLDFLTPREREVLNLVITGRLNKQIGGELGISEKTVKAHRAQVMKKMRASSLADLVRLAEQVGIRPQETGARPRNLRRRSTTKVH